MNFSTRDEDSIRKSLANSDVVINLIGKHYETKHFVPTRRADGSLSRINYTLEDVNVEIPRTLARLAREAGVDTFIHVSGDQLPPPSSPTSLSSSHMYVMRYRLCRRTAVCVVGICFGPVASHSHYFHVHELYGSSYFIPSCNQ